MKLLLLSLLLLLFYLQESDAFVHPHHVKVYRSYKSHYHRSASLSSKSFSASGLLATSRRASKTTTSTRLNLAEAEGTSEITKALNLLRNGAKLYQELESRKVDEKEAEEELKRLEKEERENGPKKHQDKEESRNTTINSTHSNTTTSNETNATNPLEQFVQPRFQAFQVRAKKTRIILLKKLAGWAFDMCDANQNGKIDAPGFYTGMLLVHLHLAKYVGVAACHPPTRDQLQELFHLADSNGSGCLDKEEFTNAVVVACAPITSRIAIYWTLLAILPVLVGRCIEGLRRHNVVRVYIAALPPSYTQKALVVLEWLLEHLLGLLLFSILVPNIFSRIDSATRNRARWLSQQRRQTNLWWLKFPSPPKDGNPQSWSSWVSGMGHSMFGYSIRVNGTPTQTDKKKNEGRSTGDDENTRKEIDEEKTAGASRRRRQHPSWKQRIFTSIRNRMSSSKAG